MSEALTLIAWAIAAILSTLAGAVIWEFFLVCVETAAERIRVYKYGEPRLCYMCKTYHGKREQCSGSRAGG